MSALKDEYPNETYFFEPVNPPASKKSRKTITPEIQRSVWDVHMGTGVKEAPCPLCGHNVIKCPGKRCGLECAHIVADKFFTGEPSALSLYPSCSACNNRCQEWCLLDFLFSAGKRHQLEKMICSIHSLYCIMNPDEPPERLLMHVVLDHLYGFEAYPAGGGIYNDVEIYTFARSVHIRQLTEEMGELTRKMTDKAKELEWVSLSVPRRKRPPTVL